MRIDSKAYDDDDIKSLDIDIDEILGDGSGNTNKNPKYDGKGHRQVNIQKHRINNGTSASSLWSGIAQPVPEKKSFQQPPPGVMMDDCPDDESSIQPYDQHEGICTFNTEDMFNGFTQSEKKLHDDTDEISDSSEEPTPGRTTSTDAHPGKPYKYIYILVVLLLLILCCLGYVIHNLVQNNDQSTKTKYQDSAASSKEGWALRPTTRPTGKPGPNTTRPPTSIPTKRPTDNPSETPTFVASVNPTKSAPEHLLELLKSTTTEKTIDAIRSWGSAQQKAYEWLHQDPSYFSYKTRSKIQRFALAVLYFSTVKSTYANEALETWMDYGAHECSWYTSWYENRLPCGSDGIFKFLALRNIDLDGTIPSELGLLSHLVALVMNDNTLTGTIPQEFGEWSSLETLDLHGNYLSGRLPAWNNVPKLNDINLSLNILTGYVPASIGYLHIKSLDLTQNPYLVGVLPFGFCSQSNPIEVLAADCDLVFCSCCTRCDSADTRTPHIAPLTIPQGPTPRPTAPPTLQPIIQQTGNRTPAPTRPMLTPQPTLDRFCVDSVQTAKGCYMVGEQIDVSYSNCNPTITDWIGIYGIESPEVALFDPLLSHRTCINEPCSGVQQISTIVLDGNVRGSSNWPLPSGRYRVFMFRGGSAIGPHNFFSKTLVITVSENSC